MGKKILIAIVIFLFFSVSIANAFPFFSHISHQNNDIDSQTLFSKSNMISNTKIIFSQPIQSLSTTLNQNTPVDFSFLPQNITLQDDTYHNVSATPSTEWWYFDATLSDNHTVQFSIHLYDFYDMNFVTTNLNIYHQGSTVVQHRKIYHADTFQFSEKTPLILKNDEILMQGIYDNKTDSFTYIISYSDFNTSINLQYKSLTKGWKGSTSAGDWVVALPHASVNGTITYNDQTISVTGDGYHDHNWNVTVNAGLNFGWIWGKTNTPNYAITWSNIMTTWFLGKPLMVINNDNDGYYNIPDEALTISVTSIQFKNGFIIPYSFIITAQTDTIDLDLKITVRSTDYSSVLGIINYWRYHIHASGNITINDDTEKIDDNNIAEFIRFRFY